MIGSCGYVDEGPFAAFAPAPHPAYIVCRPSAAGEQEAPVLRPSDRADAFSNTGCIRSEKLPQIRTGQDHHFGGIVKADRNASAVRRERRREGAMTFRFE